MVTNEKQMFYVFLASKGQGGAQKLPVKFSGFVYHGEGLVKREMMNCLIINWCLYLKSNPRRKVMQAEPCSVVSLV
jgi:hypothetical protein